MNSQEERQRLEGISSWYSNRDWGFYTRLVHMGYRTLSPYLGDGNCLEIGCADGEMTRFLAERFADLTVVDAAPNYVEAVQALIPGVEAHVSLIEDWDAPRRYDNIVFAHVLEHVTDPVKTLQRLRGFLSPGGKLHVIVPNALSLHRVAGVKMGMLDSPTDLNEADISVGHRRVYHASTLRTDIVAAGLTIEAQGGIFLKPLSNAQIEASWSDELIEAYFEMGKDFPDICGELFVVCSVEPATRPS
jgi:2-polyprenyl-3-methyl-5-hydroxy-6-metoxy-1,4-benzoquinol methylase